MTKALREKIRSGQNVYGVMVKDFTSPVILLILEECGYDFIVLDQEHASSNYLDIQNFVVTAKNMKIEVLVRPPRISYEYISKTLDMGVDGLMVPHVDTYKQAYDLIGLSKYPPIGYRSYGMRTILNKFGPFQDSADYIKKANENIIILVQAESQRSAESCSDILSISDIDGIIIGPSDFTMNLEIIGQFEDKMFEDYLQKILKICIKNQRGFGIHFNNFNLVEKWKNNGMNILMYGSVSSLIKDRANEIIQKLKK